MKARTLFLLMALPLAVGQSALAQTVTLSGMLGNGFLARFQMTRTNDQMVLEKRY